MTSTSADFRGYTLRKHKFPPEMEAKIKIILNTAKSRTEAQKLLQREKFRDEDIVRIIQKYYRQVSANHDDPQKSLMKRFRRGSRDNGQLLAPMERQSRVNTPNGSPNRRMSVKDQQLELVGFAQNLHILNQEVHKNLRSNKSGIPLANIGVVPQDYKRPPGFSLVPTLLGSNHHVLNLIKTNGKLNQSFDYHDEPSR